MRQLVVGVAVALLITVFGAYGLMQFGDNAAVTQAQSVELQGPQTGIVAVSGTGEVKANPDVAYVRVGVETEGKTAAEAQAKNNAAMQRIVKALAEMGIEKKDIQTEFFSLNPDRRYDREKGVEELVGYRAVNQLRIGVEEIAKLGEVIDVSISSGANRVHSVQYGLKQTSAFADQALQAAVAEARRKALVMAEGAGLTLGRVVSITEGGVQPVYGERAFVKSMAEDVVGTPVEPGQVSVTANVQVVFALVQ